MKQSDDDAFGRQLREAGASVTPPASEELHARVMADVRRERAEASSAVARPHTGLGWWWIIGSAAAAVVLLTVWATRTREPNTPPVVRREIPLLPSVPSMEKVVVERVKPMQTKLHEARFAYLDRDTKRLAQFLIRATPGVPTEAKKATDRDPTPSSASGT